MKISFPVCPKCASRLRGGWPSFGPQKVVCGYCGTTVSTGLSGWNEGPFSSTARKVGIVLKELLAPTCMGYTDFPLRFILNLVWITPTLCIPVIPLVRLMQMKKESLEYDKTKTPPKWKWILHQVQKK
jgi:hypothetical protein